MTGTSNSGVKPRRTKSLCSLRLTKTEIGTTFLRCYLKKWGAIEAEPLERGGFVRCRLGVMLLLAGTAAVGGSIDPDGAFGFLKSCGWVISTGWTSPCAMITRAPRFVRCQSRAANPFVRRMQPCDAGYPGNTPGCSAMPDQVMRCM